MKLGSWAILCLLGFVLLTEAAPDCLNRFTSAECRTHVTTGGGRLVLDPFTDVNQISEEQQLMLKIAVANISSLYVIGGVEPQHVIIANIESTTDTRNKVTVHFFVLNPTGSNFMPLAFRSNELYLMLDLNNQKLVDMLGYEVTALPPEDASKLPLPTYVLAIIVYVGLVVIVGLLYVATKDLRQQWIDVQETKLRRAVLGDIDMELDPESAGCEVKTAPPNDRSSGKPVKMFRDTQVCFESQVTSDDIATALGITYAAVENSAHEKNIAYKDSPPPEKTDMHPANHESSTRSDSGGSSSGSDTEEETEDNTEGVINAAFEDESDDVQITSL